MRKSAARADVLAPPFLEITTKSPEETTAFATKIAQHLGGGDVLLLFGDLGSGKTHFARSVIQSRLEVPEDVPSPTFTLVQTYETPDVEIWHADLYRLTSADEVFEIGLLDAFEHAICLVEWPDRLGADTPDDALSIRFEMTEIEGERKLAFHGSSRWTQILSNFRAPE